ncbi:hypothetical protein K2Q00_01355 [Patescibacteria group bacterium]|nr:hypothetical protein [Patescibacteria group bacterium]
MDQDMESAIRFYEETRAGSFGRQAHHHFMEAMKQGYAATPTKGTLAELPGSKTIEYVHGKWRTIDTYIVTPNSSYSGGMTMLYYGPLPVFVMQYAGYYEGRAIHCLKAALKHTYDAGKFNGGRGPGLFSLAGFTYVNHVEHSDFFGLSRGKEWICDMSGNTIGWHVYQSTYMLE